MEEIILNCRIITPMFCYGADGKTPELRPPSFKGALRFWWRAIHPNLSLKEMKEKEMEFFGGVKRSKSVKSPFSLKIKHLNFNSIKRDALPHKPNKYKAAAIPADTIFDLILFQKVSHENVSLFFLLSILGGIGGRSRRGFGCFEITSSVEGIKNIQLTNDSIKQLINKINPSFEFNTFQRNYPYIQNIQIGCPYGTYQELLEKIGDSSHENNSDYTGRIKPRRYASPVYVSIYKDGDNFYPIVTELNRTIDNTPGHEEDEGKKKQFIEDILGKK